MLIRKVALSLLVATASCAYVWGQAGVALIDGTLDLSAGDADIVTGIVASPGPSVSEAPRSVSKPVPSPEVAPLPLASQSAVPLSKPSAPTPNATVLPELAAISAPRPDQIPIPRPRPRSVPVAAAPDPRQSPARGLVTRVAMNTASMDAGAAYADGVYDGPVTDAYYGPMQIEAIVDGGRLAAIKVLQYPSDRRTSVLINRQALPMLRDEVVAAQSAKVDIVSGATLTSKAFIRSLDGALSKARPN